MSKSNKKFNKEELFFVKEDRKLLNRRDRKKFKEFMNTAKLEDIDDYLDAGDMYIINPSCTHGVSPIDPELPLDLSKNSGRWSMWCSLVKYKSLI